MFFFVNNLRLNRDRDTKCVSMCLSQDVSIDRLIHELPGQKYDINLRSNLRLTFCSHQIYHSMRIDVQYSAI